MIGRCCCAIASGVSTSSCWCCFGVMHTAAVSTAYTVLPQAWFQAWAHAQLLLAAQLHNALLVVDRSLETG